MILTGCTNHVVSQTRLGGWDSWETSVNDAALEVSREQVAEVAWVQVEGSNLGWEMGTVLSECSVDSDERGGKERGKGEVGGWEGCASEVGRAKV